MRERIDRGEATAHDAVIGAKLATILCGGAGNPDEEVSEEEILALEQEAFVSLCGEPRSRDRMAHMLERRAPLRN